MGTNVGFVPANGSLKMKQINKLVQFSDIDWNGPNYRQKTTSRDNPHACLYSSNDISTHSSINIPTQCHLVSSGTPQEGRATLCRMEWTSYGTTHRIEIYDSPKTKQSPRSSRDDSLTADELQVLRNSYSLGYSTEHSSPRLYKDIADTILWR